MTAAVTAGPAEHLEAALAAAVAAEDWTLVDAVTADLDALQDGADPAELARLDEVAALIDSGMSEFDACAAVYGRTTAERHQRQDAIRRLRGAAMQPTSRHVHPRLSPKGPDQL